MLNHSKNSHGFTLVELMVVVAIIGLLSAVAIPNFKKYQAKAKTAEAKLQLSAIYTSEQGFFGDYGMYSNCLRYMGYDPSGEKSSRYYLTGFPQITPTIAAGAYASAVNSGLSTDGLASGGCPNGAANLDGQTFFFPGKSIGTFLASEASVPGGQNPGALTEVQSKMGGYYPAAQPGIGEQSVAVYMTFRAVASGFIDQDNTQNASGPTAPGSSIFSINQAKMIFNPRVGY